MTNAGTVPSILLPGAQGIQINTGFSHALQMVTCCGRCTVNFEQSLCLEMGGFLC